MSTVVRCLSALFHGRVAEELPFHTCSTESFNSVFDSPYLTNCFHIKFRSVLTPYFVCLQSLRLLGFRGIMPPQCQVSITKYTYSAAGNYLLFSAEISRLKIETIL